MDSLTIDYLANVLQEPNRPLLRLVLTMLGADRTAALLEEALQLEAGGGMLTRDGTRHRTPGGVFCQLVKDRATPQERRRLSPRPAPQQGSAHPQAQTQRIALTWDEVPTIIQTLATAPAGEAKTMKLTLIGRPGKIETRGQAVLFRMQGKPPSALPRGLPPVPTQAPLIWNVYGRAAAVEPGEGQPGRQSG